MPVIRKSKLPRLPRQFYQGHAMVLWTHTLENRTTGWLNHEFHHRFRELLLHASSRYSLACPCYVLMPDHFHLVWTGLDGSSDQWLATAFLRKHLEPKLAPALLQDRAHDHVLREAEREHAAFQDACAYVRLNPERGGLCDDWRDWLFTGAVIPGYPDLEPRTEEYWEKFWKIYNRLVSPEIPALTRRATPRISRGEHPDQTNSNPPPRSPLRKERDRGAGELHGDTDPS